MNLKQYVTLSLKATGWEANFKAGDISAVIQDPEGVLIVLNNGLAYQVSEAFAAVAAKMLAATE